MQALRDEMDLRDRTREVHNTASAIEESAYEAQARALSKKQDSIAKDIEGAAEQIAALENASEFGNEIKLLQAVYQVMTETTEILAEPDTGQAAIAAETEAIELLLQARRNKPSGGGGGGGGSGSGGGGGSHMRAQSAALAALGPGADAATTATARDVGQATGRAGRELPEEYRSGLDAYFHALESDGTSTN